MAKIKIHDLCKKLQADIDEKGLFFKDLSAKEFLEPFYRENVFNFTDNASFWVVKYLQKIYNEDTKDVITEIVNRCIENINIDNIDYSTYIQLIQLIELFDTETFNKINSTKLLKYKYSMDFILSIYRNKEINMNKELVETSIITLLRYKLAKSYKTICEIDYEPYKLNELLSSEETKDNFEMALKQDWLFDILIKKYEEVYNITNKKKNEISDIIGIQKIDPEEMRTNLINDYHDKDILDIILYFLYVNLNGENIHITENIKLLLSHEIYILRKLGLYLINQDILKNISLLPIFFSNINSKNVVKVTNICLYEIINIFENISKFRPDTMCNLKQCSKYDYIDNNIENYLQLFPKKEEDLKYRVLHGLKQHSKLRNQFYELKNKYLYEKENPGIYLNSGIGGLIINVSPISENDFRMMPIEKQIEYLNSDIRYSDHLKQIDNNHFEETNEPGLIELFQKLLTENINKYLDNDNIFKLNKKVFIETFLDVLSSNVKQINSINRVVLFFDIIFDVILQNKDEYENLLYPILNFNLCLSEKRHKDFKKIFKFVKHIAENDFNEYYDKDEIDLNFKALNTIHGINFRCFMNHLVKIRKINEKDYNFLSYILKKDNEDKFGCFYYYLGMQYQYLTYKFEELNLLERVYKLNKNSRKYFLEGYLSYFSYIKPFEDLKPLILDSFVNKEINNIEIRARFVKMLLDLKLRFNKDEMFKEFSEYFTEKDFIDTLRFLTSKNNNNYKKTNVMKYWHEIKALNNKEYTSLLLGIFNKYCDIDDLEKYETDLEQIIQLGLPTNFVVNRSMAQFLEKLLQCLKIKQNGATIFNILYKTILSMNDVKYIYKELDIIKEILQEFKVQGKYENAQLIAWKIYKTQSIKYYSTNLKEFLT